MVRTRVQWHRPITVMWLVGVPLGMVFLTKIVGWPLSLTIALTLPVFLIWIPMSYPLAHAAGELHDRGLRVDLAAPRVMMMIIMLTMLTGALSTLTLYVYVFFRSNSYITLGVVAILAAACAWLAVLVGRRFLAEVRTPISRRDV